MIRTFESPTARGMLVVLTAAVGFIALKSQSEVWLGVLAAFAAFWLLHGLGAILNTHGRRRGFWAAFLVVASASLTMSFGPWSDVSIRGAMPPDAATWPTYLENILPTTKRLFKLYHYVQPDQRGEIQTYDRGGQPVARIAFTVREGYHPGVEQLSYDLDRFTRDEIRFYSSGSNVACRFAMNRLDIHVFLDAAHILASLLLGGIAGGLILALWPHRTGRAVRENRHADHLAGSIANELSGAAAAH